MEGKASVGVRTQTISHVLLHGRRAGLVREIVEHLLPIEVAVVRREDLVELRLRLLVASAAAGRQHGRVTGALRLFEVQEGVPAARNADSPLEVGGHLVMLGVDADQSPLDVAGD